MSENRLHVSNTPIFDQLSRERDYDRMVVGGPTLPLRPVRQNYTSPSAWVAKALPDLSVPAKGRNAKLMVNFHPLDAEESCGSVEQFFEERKAEFFRKHPNAIDVMMMVEDRVDGTRDLVIAGYESTGIVLAKKPENDWFAEHKTEPVPEEMKSRQLELYKGAVGAFAQHYNPEQTDESVNAALTDAQIHPQYADTRPMLILDDEDADEE